MKLLKIIQNSALFFLTFIAMCFVVEPLLVWVEGESSKASYPRYYESTNKFLNGIYHIKSNSQGIRYQNIPFKRSPDEERVVVIGDSFVEGEGVEADQTFPAILENQYRKSGKRISFINCGISGFGPPQYARMLSETALKYHPNKVLFVIYANDVEDTGDSGVDEAGNDEAPSTDSLNPLRNFLKEKIKILFPKLLMLIRKACYHGQRKWESAKSLDVVKETLQEARLRHVSQGRIDDWLKKVPADAIQEINESRVGFYRVKFALTRPDYWTSSLDIPTPKDEKNWKAMETIFSKMIQKCQSRKIEVGIIYAPCPYQYDPGFDTLPIQLGLVVRKEWLTETTTLEKRVEVLAQKNKIPFLNLTPLLRKEVNAFPDQNLNYKIDVHWNPRGHQVVASAIQEWLEKTYFLENA